MSAHRTSGIIFILFLTFFLILVNAAEGNNEKKNDEKKIELKTFRSYSNQLFLSAIKDNSLHVRIINIKLILKLHFIYYF